MSRKITKPAHSAAKSSDKRGRIARAKTKLTGTRADRWYGSKWIRVEKRHAIYARDSHACVYCGSTHDLTLDHVLPAESGGTNDVTNLVTACRSCNSRKGATELRAFARMIAAETGTTTRKITNRVRAALKRSIDVRAAKAELERVREEREERAAIVDASNASDSTYTDDALSFDFAA